MQKISRMLTHKNFVANFLFLYFVAYSSSYCITIKIALQSSVLFFFLLIRSMVWKRGEHTPRMRDNAPLTAIHLEHFCIVPTRVSQRNLTFKKRAVTLRSSSFRSKTTKSNLEVCNSLSTDSFMCALSSVHKKVCETL